LFFSGKVNFVWFLLLLGMLSFVIADTGFLVLSLDEEYYTGHPIDILYLWAYLFFLFGSYHYLRIFKKRGKEDQFDNQENFR
jgi:hypothetical protein